MIGTVPAWFAFDRIGEYHSDNTCLLMCFSFDWVSEKKGIPFVFAHRPKWLVETRDKNCRQYYGHCHSSYKHTCMQIVC